MDRMEPDTLLQFTRNGRVLTVTMARPPVNALNDALVAQSVSYTHLTLPTNREV